MRMRMQPWDAAVPIDPIASVPWMPAPSKMPIQRALSGLFGGRTGITWPASDPAQELFGTLQAGFTALFRMWYSPAGVSRPIWPTAIELLFSGLRFLLRV